MVVGPGCLAFSLALSVTPQMRSLGVSNVTRSLMERIAIGLSSGSSVVIVKGTSDLVCGGRKFSGNAQRWLKNAFLHHGTMLYDFNLSLISRLLKNPSRQPDYREGRDHAGFVGNFTASRERLINSLAASWNATVSSCPPSILLRAAAIAATRYSDPEWFVQK